MLMNIKNKNYKKLWKEVQKVEILTKKVVKFNKLRRKINLSNILG